MNKKSYEAKVAIETLSEIHTTSKPILISETAKRINIALIQKTCGTVERVLSLSLETGVCRVFNCEDFIIFENEVRAYNELARRLKKIYKENQHNAEI